ncbi:MAG: apolipoprotein N-acyltransferase [Victivallaceae bacterium]|nr:apolipoprotein N-acyltransferase [Victivallaceae bacterium]
MPAISDNNHFNGSRRCRNEAWRVRRLTGIGKIAVLFLSGMLTSASMPPLDWSAAAWVALIPLFWIASEQSTARAAASGFCWGLGYAFTGFYWLREIDPVIPYLIAPVLALFPALWAGLVPGLRRGLLIPNDVQLRGHAAVREFIPRSALKTFFYAVVLAAWWCVTEGLRARLLPWNYLAVSQWRNIPLLRICSVTGTYGISFLIVLINLTLVAALKERFRSVKTPTGFPQAYPFYLSLLLLLAVLGAGAYGWRPPRPRAGIEFSAGLVQGDISQRRQATAEQALEAMNVYLKLSYELAARKPGPDIIIWPETATPFAYRDTNWLCADYRRRLTELIRAAKLPLLIGTIDFEKLPPGAKRLPGITNSAFWFGLDGRPASRYDKIQRVPFGEYIPFRRYLPEWMIRCVDMHRDLVPGKNFSPLTILPGVRAGISICYEDVFEYIARYELLNNANLLLVITNDAWYPTSSEPDQHLANCVFRTVETGLPMLRCGNNSASCLIQPDGRISACLFTKTVAGRTVAAPEIRGRRAGVIRVEVPVVPELTFYARYGNVFLGLCWLAVLAGMTVTVLNWRRRKVILTAKFGEDRARSADRK